MPLKYNPLLPIGLEDTGNGGSSEEIAALQQAVTNLQQQATILQNAVNALKGNKITKCFVAADLVNLESGEIFEWQGVDSTVDDVAFKNGFFYKSLITTQTVPAGTQYFEYPEGFPTINLNGYTFAPGKYYLVQDNTPGVSSNFSSLYVIQYRPNTDLYTVSEDSTPTVGQKFYNKNTLSYITVTGINDHTLTFSDGTSFTYEYVASSSFNNLFRIIAENGDMFDLITSGMGALICHYTLSGNVFSLTDWFRIQEPILRTLADAITIRVASYTQTDTQPNYTLPPATTNKLGGVKVGDGLNILDGVLSGLRNMSNTAENDILITANLQVNGSIAQFFVNWNDLGLVTSGFTAAFIDALLTYIHTNFANKLFVGLVKPNNVRSTIGNCYKQNNVYYTTMLIMGVDGSLCFLHEGANVWTLDDITKTVHTF